MGKSKKKKKNKEDRLAVTGVVVTPEYVFEHFVDETCGIKCSSGEIFSEKLKKNFEVYKNSQRYLLFKQSGCTCVSCGMTADKCVLISESSNDNRGHFEFVGDKDGKPVIMTKDHIIPRAMGGKDILENYQPMCQTCNVAKKHSYDPQELKDAILNGTADAISNYTVKVNIPDARYMILFRSWVELTKINYIYDDSEHEFKFLPETRSQLSFIQTHVSEFTELLLATYNRNIATSIDKSTENSILTKKAISMNLYEQLKSEKITQMKDKNHAEVGILSVLLGEIDRVLFNIVPEKRTDVVVDETVAKVLKKLISGAEENLQKFGGDGYQKEIEVLSRWVSKLPKEPEVLSEAETKQIVDGLVAVNGNSKKIIGKIMGEISKTYGATVNKSIVKAYLDSILV